MIASGSAASFMQDDIRYRGPIIPMSLLIGKQCSSQNSIRLGELLSLRSIRIHIYICIKASQLYTYQKLRGQILLSDLKGFIRRRWLRQSGSVPREGSSSREVRRPGNDNVQLMYGWRNKYIVLETGIYGRHLYVLESVNTNQGWGGINTIPRPYLFPMHHFYTLQTICTGLCLTQRTVLHSYGSTLPPPPTPKVLCINADANIFQRLCGQMAIVWPLDRCNFLFILLRSNWLHVRKRQALNLGKELANLVLCEAIFGREL